MAIHLTITVHAYDRMDERGISKRDVAGVIEHGVVVESYPDDKPYPSRLLLGYVAGRALHVVAGWDEGRGEWIVITVYEPGLDKWEPDNRTRRR